MQKLILYGVELGRTCLRTLGERRGSIEWPRDGLRVEYRSSSPEAPNQLNLKLGGVLPSFLDITENRMTSECAPHAEFNATVSC